MQFTERHWLTPQSNYGIKSRSLNHHNTLNKSLILLPQTTIIIPLYYVPVVHQIRSDIVDIHKIYNSQQSVVCICRGSKWHDFNSEKLLELHKINNKLFINLYKCLIETLLHTLSFCWKPKESKFRISLRFNCYSWL